MDNKRVWEAIRPYLLILPAMAGIILFVIYPVIYLVYLSLYKYNLLNKDKSQFVGLSNYKQILSREDFYITVSNTFIYTIGVVGFTMLISLIIAVWLNKKGSLNSIVQAGIFTPHIISIVSIALVWMWMMEPSHGLLNFILKAVGFPPSQWLQSSGTAMMSVMIVSIWHNVGYFALIILAALQSIPPSIYEAAALDNASKFKVFYKITLPLISPQLFFILIIMTIGSFKVFDTVRIMTGGGPNNATTTLVYYIYKFRTTNIGYASAAGVILMILIAILTVVYFRLLSKKIHYQ
ncbi:carbohydrate ABC transporter permease [Paenibacillus sp. J2TS4]|uniref:carbohydrate ABC transporter permease n=1 Tax=Paenibacillus sp. J2TS4 TaxID=2807194 RepID=UPI001B19E677|nr:sugar ABC transporter permease [Paenibacillus sp. J2TS4]GIP34540.1 ABC transporter permease [Paenibacillus sp. J2TS4]